MTVKMASGTMFGGMLYEKNDLLLVEVVSCGLCVDREPVWPSGKALGW